jgi:hypothetical protein
VVVEEHGSEEYVHLKSREDEYEFLESNMPRKAPPRSEEPPEGGRSVKVLSESSSDCVPPPFALLFVAVRRLFLPSPSSSGLSFDLLSILLSPG